ncbi:MAG TPA: hypothetical protein VML75_16230 [Kofleriaceae bacterium]|nr:hypothetical protein [Kofleriaceae bacterium]
MHETLAQYSALMVMEDEFGSAGIRRVLAREHGLYLRGRAGERGVEPSLARVERQSYVHYHKGALAMYALRDAMGEDRLNQSLSRFLARASAAQPPYTTTAELLDELRPALPQTSKHLVEDLFEQITMYDVAVVAATASERPDGTFLLRVELGARKLRGDGAGAEREIPMDESVDIVVHGEQASGASHTTELLLERRLISTTRSSFDLVLAERPVRVEIDPYFKLIDRDRDDNVRIVVPAQDPR